MNNNDNILNMFAGEAALFKVEKSNSQDKNKLNKFIPYLVKVDSKLDFDSKVDVVEYDSNFDYYIFYLHNNNDMPVLDSLVESLSDKVEITTFTFSL